jgi:methyl-accepting chemotaxis protein
MGPLERNFYSALMEQLATALKGSILIEEKATSQELLASTLAALKSKAQVVSTNSRAIMERVNEVSSATGKMAVNERNISKQSEDVLDKVIQAVRIANEAASVIQTLKDQSRRIAQITGMISDIAETTNMLSLNANIQAARAGEAGRGFKVVANEIQNLAQLTVRSTQEIAGIVKTIQKSGEETFSAVSAVIDVISKVSDLSILIKEAVGEQAAAANQVSSSLIETATGSREIFEAIREVALAEDTAQAAAQETTVAGRPPPVKEQQS